MNHLSYQFFEQFLDNLQGDNSIPVTFKKQMKTLHSEGKIATGNHLKELLMNPVVDSQQKGKDEDSKN